MLAELSLRIFGIKGFHFDHLVDYVGKPHTITGDLVILKKLHMDRFIKSHTLGQGQEISDYHINSY